jgi:hypothetical protein
MLRLCSLAALVALAAPLPAADPQPVPVAAVGIVSADRKLVFLPGKDGVEAVDLATGKLAWANKDAPKVAGASDQLVIGWVGDEKKPNTFRAVLIDAATGKTVAKSDPIALPEWASTGTTWGRTFRIAAKPGVDGVSVFWQAGAFYAGGARPTPEIEAAARKDERGTAKVDLKTGKVTASDAKPKDADFAAGLGGPVSNTVGEYEFQMVEEVPGFRPGAPMRTKVTFTVLKGKTELWKRELAGNPWSPPPP